MSDHAIGLIVGVVLLAFTALLWLARSGDAARDHDDQEGGDIAC